MMREFEMMDKNPELKIEKLKKEFADLQIQKVSILENEQNTKERKELVFWLIGLFGVGIILITVAILTKFRNANSFWSLPLGLGFIVFGILLANAQRKKDKKTKSDRETRFKSIDREIDQKKNELQE
jgi:hypothetical protein